jgi:hypothetical protein
MLTRWSSFIAQVRDTLSDPSQQSGAIAIGYLQVADLAFLLISQQRAITVPVAQLQRVLLLSTVTQT